MRHDQISRGGIVGVGLEDNNSAFGGGRNVDIGNADTRPADFVEPAATSMRSAPVSSSSLRPSS